MVVWTVAMIVVGIVGHYTFAVPQPEPPCSILCFPWLTEAVLINTLLFFVWLVGLAVITFLCWLVWFLKYDLSDVLVWRREARAWAKERERERRF